MLNRIVTIRKIDRILLENYSVTRPKPFNLSTFRPSDFPTFPIITSH